MPEITPDEVLANLNAFLGRPTPALDEILRILHDNLPPVLERLSLPAIAAYYWAGERIDETHFPCLVIAGSFDTTEMGVGHLDRDLILVTCAVQPVAARRQLQESCDIACVIRGLFYAPQFRHRHDNESGRRLWNSLIPMGLSIVPSDYEHYSGWIAHFEMLQTPNSQLWSEYDEQ